MRVDKKYDNTEKKGREFIFQSRGKIACRGGIVNKHKFKSCYFRIGAHFTITDTDKPMSELKRLFHQFSRVISSSLDNKVFHPNFIQSNEIPESFALTGKAYASTELNLYFKKNIDLKELEIILNDINNKVQIHADNFNEFELNAKRVKNVSK